MTDKEREKLDRLFELARLGYFFDPQKRFVLSIETRYKKWGSKSNFTQRQWAVIDRLAEIYR